MEMENLKFLDQQPPSQESQKLKALTKNNLHPLLHQLKIHHHPLKKIRHHQPKKIP